MSVWKALRARLPQGLPLEEEIWNKRHRGLVLTLWAHAIAVPIFGIVRDQGVLHVPLETAPLVVFALVASAPGRSRGFRAAMATVGLLTSSGIIVHFSGGSIEAHFHFFVMVTLVILYQSWFPFLIAVAYVFLHHGVFGTIAPRSVYNHPAAIADPWTWAAIHGLFILGLCVAGLIVWKRTEELTTAREEAQRQLYEAADRANRIKNEFLSQMSHELRTPLNAVLGFTQLLEMDPLTAEQKQATGEILKGGKHLLELINEVLDLARIEAGGLRLSMEAIDAVDVADECVSLLTPVAAQSGIRLVLEKQAAADRSIWVTVDRQRLKQVLLNLISNGIKYNGEHGSVSVSFERAERDQRLKIHVTDTGPGIAPEQMEQLFAPFERLGAEGSEIEGTGLGLALSKPLMEAMGGSISVASEPRRGSTFTVEVGLAGRPSVPADHVLRVGA